MTDSSSEGGPESLVSRLIRAGVEEMPPPRTLQKALAAVGLGVSSFGAATTAAALGSGKAAAPLTALVLAKWAGIGLTSGTVLAIAAHGAGWQPAASRARTVVAPLATTSAVASSVGPRIPPAVTTQEAATPASGAPAPLRSRDEPSLLEKAPLAAEVLYVDRGRAAYQRGDAAATLTTLDDYERTFPDARLLPEVLYLRMEAYRRTGRHAHALALARRLTDEFPRSPHVGSARLLLDGKGNP